MTLVAKGEGSSRLGESRQEAAGSEGVVGDEKRTMTNDLGACFWKVTNPG